jgi:MFS family permease
MPWYTPADSLEGQNVRYLYSETAWFGVINGISLTFVSVFALRLGATTQQVGWLAALPALVNVFWLVPAARIIERQRHRIPIILWTCLFQRLGYLVMALMPLLVADYQVQALIVINTLITLPTAVVSTAITALIPDLTTAERRGQVVSTRWLILSVVATAAALIGGSFLDLVPVPLNYQILFGVAALLSLLSLRHLRRIRVPDAVITRQLVQPKQRVEWGWMSLMQSAAGSLRQSVRRSQASIRTHRDYVYFTAASFVLHCGLFLPAALWSVIRVRDLQATDTWIGLIAVVIDAATIGGYFFWGKMSARWGDRSVLIITSLGVALYALVTALVPSIEWMLLTSIVGGLSWSGCNLALFNGLLNVCPARQRASYIAGYTALMNVSAFAMPLLGASLSDLAGIRTAFLVATVVRLAGALLFFGLPRAGRAGLPARAG